MNRGDTINWHEANQHYLMSALAMVCNILEDHASNAKKERQNNQSHEALELAAHTMSSPPAIEALCATFHLSPFERDLLLMCAGMELDATFASLCARAHGNEAYSFPTFNLALAALPDAHWNALLPASPLRYWRLIEVGGAGSPLTSSPLRIDERILHYLSGLSYLDERLSGMVMPLSESDSLAPSHQKLAKQIADIWSQADPSASLPVIQLCGDDSVSKQTVASTACSLLGLQLNKMSAHVIPATPSELDAFVRLWGRESALNNRALLIDGDTMDIAEKTKELLLVRLIENIKGPLMVTSRMRQSVDQHQLITFDVRKLTTNEQEQFWQECLKAHLPVAVWHSLNGDVTSLVSQFNLSTASIQATCTHALNRYASFMTDMTEESSHQAQSSSDNQELRALLWDACRIQAGQELSELAQPIDPIAVWEDLVIPDAQKQILQEIAAHVRQRRIVYETWGFSSKSLRGLGISALFAGSSGTGKTMAAEVLANELSLDLYRIDLSQVVSKYIGETEKNLRRVFDAAEAGSAILLFDEADALFGKRSEVKDSHDRYANIEISYLLQRMEAYKGLAILTTNMKDAIDTAFLRRIRFVVRFPFPDAASRAEIWKRIYPDKTPTKALDVSKLAQLNVAGGNIRNIALNAAFLAADAQKPVQMSHLLKAARTEYIKLEKSITNTEIRGWGKIN